MTKLTGVFLLLILFLGTTYAQTRTDLGVTNILSPSNGSILFPNQLTTYTITITNNTGITFTANDTIKIWYKVNNKDSVWKNSIIPGLNLPHGSSFNDTLDLKLDTIYPSGNIKIGFGAQWSKNKPPNTIIFFYNHYTFEKPTRTDLGITSIISPVNGSTLYSNQLTTFTVSITNNTNSTFTTNDTLNIWTKIDAKDSVWKNSIMPSTHVSPGSSFPDTIQLKLDSSYPLGNIKIGIGAQWSKNKPPNTMIFFYNNYIFSNTQGIKEFSQTISHIYYSNQNLYITLSNKLNTPAKVKITNLYGQILLQTTLFPFTTHENKFALSTGILPKGIYIFTLLSNDETTSLKFFVE